MPEVVLTGAAGRIEGRYSQGKSETAPVALILHPHPKAGGQMNNPVTVQLFHLFMKRGFSVLRFNFRGVGRSQGEFDSGIGELADAATALDWLQSTNPAASQCWVAGYSFGAWVGMQLLMRRPETDGFISVSPPTNAYDFSFLAPCPARRRLTNRFIAETQADRLRPFFLANARRITGDGGMIMGCEGIVAAFAAQFAGPGFVPYVRTTQRVDLDVRGERAAEHGH